MNRFSSMLTRGTFGAVAVSLFAGTMAVAAPASDPQAQALAVYKTFKSKDWSKLYDLAAFPPSAPRNEKDRKAFIAAIDKGFSGNPVAQEFISGLSNIATGKAQIKGNKA